MQIGFPEGDHAADRGGSSTTRQPGSREKRIERPGGARIASGADTRCDKTPYHFTGETEWAALSSPAYCWPENNAANKSVYGGFYDGYAVLDNRALCPTGWRIPTDGDWIDLELELGLPQAEAYLDAIRGEDKNVGGKLRAMVNRDAPDVVARQA